MKQFDEAKDESIMKKYITLYGVGCDYETFNAAIKEYFQEYELKYDNNWINFEINGTPVSINTNKSEDSSFFKKQASGMSNFFSNSKMPMSELKETILRKISEFDSIYGFMVIESKDDNTVINLVNDLAFKIAEELNLFVLHPNMNLYAPNGKLFISFPSGDSEWIDKSDARVLRRERSNNILKVLGIDYNENLPVVEDSSQVKLKKLR